MTCQFSPFWAKIVFDFCYGNKVEHDIVYLVHVESEFEFEMNIVFFNFNYCSILTIVLFKLSIVCNLVLLFLAVAETAGVCGGGGGQL